MISLIALPQGAKAIKTIKLDPPGAKVIKVPRGRDLDCLDCLGAPGGPQASLEGGLGTPRGPKAIKAVKICLGRPKALKIPILIALGLPSQILIALIVLGPLVVPRPPSSEAWGPPGAPRQSRQSRSLPRGTLIALAP